MALEKRATAVGSRTTPTNVRVLPPKLANPAFSDRGLADPLAPVLWVLLAVKSLPFAQRLIRVRIGDRLPRPTTLV